MREGKSARRSEFGKNPTDLSHCNDEVAEWAR
jgi:hypothetical protein